MVLYCPQTQFISQIQLEDQTELNSGFGHAHGEDQIHCTQTQASMNFILIFSCTHPHTEADDNEHDDVRRRAVTAVWMWQCQLATIAQGLKLHKRACMVWYGM